MINRKELFKDVKKIVVKIGTSSLTTKDGKFNREFAREIARQVSKLKSEGKDVILVSSGAIGTGCEALDFKERPKSIPLKQATAAVGQSILMHEWSQAFSEYGFKVAQILLTYDAFSDRKTYLNLRNSMSSLLELGVIPIINENDPICVHEIGETFGDNDTLSAMVSSKVEADLLILMTDIDGLYTKNPKKSKDAKKIPVIEEITPEIESFGGGAGDKGTGGMKTKLEAAKIAQKSGCYMIIASSEEKDLISRVMSGEDIGTLFLPKKSIEKNKIRWIALSKPKGKIIVDEGAKNALLDHKSLLPRGVIDVDGNFDAGDIVAIESNKTIFAKGVTNYTDRELKKIKGRNTDEIESILGYKNYNEIIKHENIGILK
ncbi:MAG: Uridylate kinase [Candidatus Methanofastidiosum methylothiophilum]|uniref:Glutamate 5-kinase n=1 Tax=Candidatus Methanofastidiosum methylothiophilum TaxID=1705564 RepID=A0A150IUR1_9EURY|nr:MAG: Uridylate kinase [Candidatus Methanofastidiosum methylthiophilus]KYC48751.1 MAG: Uridylate kinase [Candidatus Methanofastidiosum methylthiophilus]KYC51399.1 MAG: Uridylate kinase [Candidatus Methanofastidiosum methylthiophilus]